MGNINNIKSIQHPLHSADFAEFAGILLGDGGLTKYQLTITLNHIEEREYMEFVIELIEKLFGVEAAIYHRPDFSVFNIVISRRELIIFCTENLGINVGDKIKQQIDIPSWIENNETFSIACMRGLFDTDGSVVLHRYSVGGKQYCYKKLEFCSMSPPLRKSVYDILYKLDMHPRIAREKSVWLDSQKDVKRYFEAIGSHNPKHLKRYLK
jgi:hypothetical protein